MAEIIVTICTAGPNRLYWQAVARKLDGRPDLIVRVIHDPNQLADELRDSDSDILLFESARTDFPADSSRMLDANPRAAIIGIDPSGVDTVIRLREVGLDLIADIIRSVRRDRESDDGPAETTRFIGTRELRAAINRNDARVTPAVDVTDENSFRTPNEPALQWLEVCLHQQLLAEDDVERRLQLQNLPINAAGLRALLGDDAALDAGELAAKREQIEAHIGQLANANIDCDGALTKRWLKIARAFGLDRLDRLIVLLALAPEIDGRFARVFGFLNDDYARRRPTSAIAARILHPDRPLAANVVIRLTADTQLSRYKLVSLEQDELTPSAERELIAPADIVSTVIADLPENVTQGVSLSRPEPLKTMSRSTERLRERLVAWRNGAVRDDEQPPTIDVGKDEATTLWVRRALSAAGCDVVSLTLAPDGNADADQALALCAARVAVMNGAAVFAACPKTPSPQPANGRVHAVLKTLRDRVRLLVVHGATATHIGRIWGITRPEPNAARRAEIWQDCAAALGLSLPSTHADNMARTCRFLEPGIYAVLNLCGPYCTDLKLLQAAARRVSRVSLPSAVRPIEATYGWKDIVLAPNTLHTLRSIPTHVRFAQEVLDDWGFRARVPYGHGVAALFAGPSGTGKTMAAQIIATELGVQLLKVDLSQTVSKYIGETEKNISAVFDAAESASAVLLIDEADALLGKRTEVQDAHDRYANVEVAYLLQRMEEYGGLVILTTNLRQNLDSAFMRRLRFVCEFVMPTAELRSKIWKLAFPEDAPLAKDVEFNFLARRLDLTGGYIQKIALCAAFRAVDDGGVITNDHILEATREELARLGITNASKKLAGAVA